MLQGARWTEQRYDDGTVDVVECFSRFGIGRPAVCVTVGEGDGASDSEPAHCVDEGVAVGRTIGGEFHAVDLPCVSRDVIGQLRQRDLVSGAAQCGQAQRQVRVARAIEGSLGGSSGRCRRVEPIRHREQASGGLCHLEAVSEQLQ